MEIDQVLSMSHVSLFDKTKPTTQLHPSTPFVVDIFRWARRRMYEGYHKYVDGILHSHHQPTNNFS
jgi:hypothetical protein